MKITIITFHLQIYCLLTWGMYECPVLPLVKQKCGDIFYDVVKTRKMTHMCDGRNFFPRLSLAFSLVVELRDPGRTWSVWPPFQFKTARAGSVLDHNSVDGITTHYLGESEIAEWYFQNGLFLSCDQTGIRSSMLWQLCRWVDISIHLLNFWIMFLLKGVWLL